MTDTPPQNPAADGEAWVTAADGNRYWGSYGAAGILLHDPDRGVLLQHRAPWTANGDTWGVPGGAKHATETDLAAALRESHEEAGIDPTLITPRFGHTVDRGGWHYTTIIATADSRTTATIQDGESCELRWVQPDEVPTLNLHPAFREAWEQLQHLIHRKHAVIIDTANVIGATPNGWWQDRLGAAETLRARLGTLQAQGVPPQLCGTAAPELPHLQTIFPHLVMVTEGQTKPLESCPGITVVPAPESGDATVFAQAASHLKAGYAVTAVTSDRELRHLLSQIGCATVGTGTLLQILD